MKTFPNVVLRLFVIGCQTAILACVAPASADASSLSLIPFGSGPTRSYSLYLNGDSLNGDFDTIFFQARPTAPTVFANNNSGLSGGAPRPAGQTFTYPNRLLDLDPLDDPSGLGLMVLKRVNTPSEVSFFAGKLNGKISTETQPGERLFLANLYSPIESPDGIAQVALYSGGQLVFTNTITWDLGSTPAPLPPPPPRPPAPLAEPASAGLAGLALILVAVYRRQS